MPEVLRTTTPTARKPHRCQQCGTTIQPGRKYDRATCVGDDGIYEWVTCLDCASGLAAVWDWAGHPYDEGVGPDTYLEWAEQNCDMDGDAASFLARWNAAREG